jgi:hypothetical protein
MTDPNRPPLWQVMQNARPSGLTTPDRFWMYERDCFAAEIRAIADWLVPDEPNAPRSTDGSWNAAVQMGSDAIWMQRQHFRKLLLAEADKAEGFPLDSPEGKPPGNPMGPEAGE